MATATAMHTLKPPPQPVPVEAEPTCTACGQAWPCPDIIARADAEYPFITECDWPQHPDDQTTCGPAEVRVYVFKPETGGLWEWGVQTLCATAWDSLENGFLYYPMQLTVHDVEVRVVPIQRPLS